MNSAQNALSVDDLIDWRELTITRGGPFSEYYVKTAIKSGRLEAYQAGRRKLVSRRRADEVLAQLPRAPHLGIVGAA